MLDLTNKVFGFLTAIKPLTLRDSCGNIIWECVCNCKRNTCPKTIRVAATYLRRGHVISCMQQQHDKTIHAAIRQYFTRTRQQAKYRNYIFELTLEQFHNLIRQPCYYCDRKDIKIIEQANTKRWYLKACGIDRIDNSIGYTLENSVPCCQDCNKAKLTMSAEAYITLCKAVARKFS